MPRLYLNFSLLHNAFLVQEPNEFAATFSQERLEDVTRKLYSHYRQVFPNSRHFCNIHTNPSKVEFAELFKNGRVHLIPYCILNSAQAIRVIAGNSDTLLYGVDCDLDKVIGTVRRMKSKIYCANLIKRLIPEFANDFIASDKQDLFQKAKEFMETIRTPVVIKPEYTQGGFGSGVIHTEEELRQYISRLEVSGYLPFLEVQEDNGFIIERYIPTGTSIISTASYIKTPIEAADILIWSAHSEDLQRRGCCYPYNSTPARDLHKKVVEIMEREGHLGFFQVEHLEEKFGEINSRHTHSFALMRFMRRYYPNMVCFCDTITTTEKQLMALDTSKLFDGERGILVYSLRDLQGATTARVACIEDTVEKAKEQIDAIRNGTKSIFHN